MKKLVEKTEKDIKNSCGGPSRGAIKFLNTNKFNNQSDSLEVLRARVEPGMNDMAMFECLYKRYHHAKPLLRALKRIIIEIGIDRELVTLDTSKGRVAMLPFIASGNVIHEAMGEQSKFLLLEDLTQYDMEIVISLKSHILRHVCIHADIMARPIMDHLDTQGRRICCTASSTKGDYVLGNQRLNDNVPAMIWGDKHTGVNNLPQDAVGRKTLDMGTKSVMNKFENMMESYKGCEAYPAYVHQPFDEWIVQTDNDEPSIVTWILEILRHEEGRFDKSVPDAIYNRLHANVNQAIFTVVMTIGLRKFDDASVINMVTTLGDILEDMCGGKALVDQIRNGEIIKLDGTYVPACQFSLATENGGNGRCAKYGSEVILADAFKLPIKLAKRMFDLYNEIEAMYRQDDDQTMTSRSMADNKYKPVQNQYGCDRHLGERMTYENDGILGGNEVDQEVNTTSLLGASNHFGDLDATGGVYNTGGMEPMTSYLRADETAFQQWDMDSEVTSTRVGAAMYSLPALNIEFQNHDVLDSFNKRFTPVDFSSNHPDICSEMKRICLRMDDGEYYKWKIENVSPDGETRDSITRYEIKKEMAPNDRLKGRPDGTKFPELGKEWTIASRNKCDEPETRKKNTWMIPIKVGSGVEVIMGFDEVYLNGNIIGHRGGRFRRIKQVDNGFIISGYRNVIRDAETYPRYETYYNWKNWI